MSLQPVPCPLCKQEAVFIDVRVPNRDANIQKYGALYAGKAQSEWKICGQCGFVHQNPRPSTEALNQFYIQSNYHNTPIRETAEEHLAFARWYFGEKIDFAVARSGLKSGSVFDIGCGRGGVLKLFEERGWSAYGVEPDRRLAKFAVDEFKLRGVRREILDSRFTLEQKVNLVFSNHAFEHFANLDEVMKGVQNITENGGYLFIAVPTYFHNKSSLSKLWMNSGHYSLFTHKSLNSLVGRYGFDEVAHTYSGWKKEVDDLWYLAKFTGLSRDPKEYFEDPAHVSRYLRVINPLRSLAYYPIYSHWATRVRLYSAAKLFVSSPSVFFEKLSRYVKRRSQAS